MIEVIINEKSLDNVDKKSSRIAYLLCYTDRLHNWE